MTQDEVRTALAGIASELETALEDENADRQILCEVTLDKIDALITVLDNNR
jgi:hypothetical protein